MNLAPDTFKSWSPPEHFTRIQTIDAHTAGEPLRVIIGGFPAFSGKTMLDRRRYIATHFDHLRQSLMWEPRGHADMYGCLVTESVSEIADFGVIFTHNDGYSTMCGHGIIAVTKVALETGFITKKEPVTHIKIDSPAGLILVTAKISRGVITDISFENVPSFVLMDNEEIEIAPYGRVSFDVAYGGAFYAFVDADRLGIDCSTDNVRRLIDVGMTIKQEIISHYDIRHPIEADLSFLYGTIFLAPPRNESNHSRNVCIFAEGEVDRSPTGTGVSARMALHYSRDEVALDEEITIESIIGTTFKGTVVREDTCGPYEAIIPRVSGMAYITGIHDYIIDPEDPLRDGFLIR